MNKKERKHQSLKTSHIRASRKRWKFRVTVFLRRILSLPGSHPSNHSLDPIFSIERKLKNKKRQRDGPAPPPTHTHKREEKEQYTYLPSTWIFLSSPSVMEREKYAFVYVGKRSCLFFPQLIAIKLSSLKFWIRNICYVLNYSANLYRTYFY